MILHKILILIICGAFTVSKSTDTYLPEAAKIDQDSKSLSGLSSEPIDVASLKHRCRKNTTSSVLTSEELKIFSRIKSGKAGVYTLLLPDHNGKIEYLGEMTVTYYGNEWLYSSTDEDLVELKIESDMLKLLDDKIFIGMEQQEVKQLLGVPKSDKGDSIYYTYGQDFMIKFTIEGERVSRIKLGYYKQSHISSIL